MKNKFKDVVSLIKRDGINELMNWLENETDFFTAPASTLYHGNYEGGLLEHSLNVLNFALINFNYLIKKKPELSTLKESIIICSLFHDICKTNFYKQDTKWFKDANNQWQSYIGWSVDEKFPLGHGEKSLYLISQHIKLNNNEALAIRWHMTSFEVSTIIPGFVKYSYDAAFEEPLVKIIHAADIMATSIEKTIKYK